jgi:hypothetical protein
MSLCDVTKSTQEHMAFQLQGKIDGLMVNSIELFFPRHVVMLNGA